MARQSNLAVWQQSNFRWMDDDEDPDSDTDSKLSGSAIVDSVMKKLRNKHFKDTTYVPGELALDPIRDQTLSEHDEDLGEERWDERGRERRTDPGRGAGRYGPSSHMSNGYSSRSPGNPRRNVPGNSPGTHRHARRREYEQTQIGMYPSRKKEILSPVPETTSSGAHVVEVTTGPGHWSPMPGPNTRSLENLHQHHRFLPPHDSPPRIREGERYTAEAGRPPYRPSPDSMFSKHSQSHESLPYNHHQESSRYDNRDGAASDINIQTGGYHGPQQRRSSIGSQSGAPHHSGSGYNAVSIPVLQPHSYSETSTFGYGNVSIPGQSMSHHHIMSGYGAVSVAPHSASHHHITSGYNAVSIPSHIASPSHSYRGYGSVSIPSQGRMVHSHSSGPGSGISGAQVGSVVPPPSLVSHNRNRSWHTTEIQSHLNPPHSGRTPPSSRANYEYREIPRDSSYHSNLLSETSGSRYTDTTSQDLLDQAGSTLRSESSQTREPNLNDVVDFLSSEDLGLVSNAASYLQHLAYGDDSMKAKIRQFGAIPVLVSQLRNPDNKVQLSVLGALRNLSYGRSNEENRLEIAGEHGLSEIMLALKMSRVPEVRSLLTGVLWNLSSSEQLKVRIIKTCLQDIVEIVLVPYSGWSASLARDPTTKPPLIQWNMELRNITGTLRNVSSAGEPARVFMRACQGLVDSLVWSLKAAVQQRQAADEKTVENVVCILRNLSYRLENEIDPQEGADDVLDHEWEMEQHREMDELQRSFHKSTPGCFAFLSRPHPSSEKVRPSLPVTRPMMSVDFANPDRSALPKRNKPVYGMALLWQPDVVYPYLALIEHYNGCAETMEAAAGAIQNLTACNWKWAVYSRNIIRTSNGLHVIGDLLNNGHDAVVRAAATALRNLAIDPRIKANLGVDVIPTIIPRLPFGSNHLGISEDTTIALLCLLMELSSDNVDNARLFREKDGLPYLTRLSRSRQHTTKVVFAANKVCSILHEYKDCRSSLKKEGWELSQYIKLSKETEEQFDFNTSCSISRDYRGSGRKSKKSSKKRKKSKNKSSMEATGETRAEVSNETRSVQPQPLPQSGAANYKIGDIREPGYSAVESNQPSPTPISAIYQTINDPDLKGVAQNPRTEAAPSTASGPLSTASDEDPAPDPNATYAQVNIEQKRASRKQREREHQQQEQSTINMEAIDSWV